MQNEVTLKKSKTRTRIGILSFYFMQGLCFASWASRIPDIKTSLGMNEATLGSVLFAIPIGQLLTMPFAGLIITRYGSVRILLVSMILYTSMLMGIGFSATISQLFCFLFLFGVFGNFINISVNTQGVFIENYYKRPIMASFHGGWSIAGFTGALLGLLAVNLHLSPFQHFTGIFLLVVLLFILNFRMLFPDTGKSAAKDKKKFKLKKPEKLLLQLGLIGFFGMASEGCMFDWSGVYFKEVVHAPEKLVTLGYTLFMITMATGRFVADKLIILYGRKKLLQASGLLISTGLFLSVLFPDIIICSIAFMIVGLGVSSVVPVVYSIAGKKSSVPTNVALVIVSSVSFFGFLLAPPLIGYIAQMLDLRYSYAVIGILGLCIFGMVSGLRILKKST